MLGILLDGRDLAVGLAHEGLQLLLEKLIGSLRCGRLNALTVSRPGLALVLSLGLILPGGGGSEIIVPGSALSLGLGLQPLDGQIDLTVVIADNHDLHILAFGQVLADITDVSIGYLRNMHHAGLVFRQCHERAEIGDRLNFAL